MPAVTSVRSVREASLRVGSLLETGSEAAAGATASISSVLLCSALITPAAVPAECACGPAARAAAWKTD